MSEEGPVIDALFGIGPTVTSSSPSMRVAAYSGADGTTVYRSPTMNPEQQQPMMMTMMMKKKRGRPRKYSSEGGEGTGGNIPLALMPPPPPAQPSVVAEEGGMSFKKARGRPPGSTNKIKKDHFQPLPLPLPLGSAGVGFTPHVIAVKAGEDVSSKIMSFSQNGPRAVCILSANGAISNVTLRQAATSGGTATFEGRFEILSLCGSFLLTEVGGQRSRTGGLSVSLAGPDGRVLGGCVAGLLTAASPVQVIVGSFIPDGRKELKTQNPPTEPTHLSSLPQMPMPMSMSASMPPMLFSGGGGSYAAPPPPPTAAAAAAGGGVSSNSPPSNGGNGGGSFSEYSSEEEEEEEEEEEGSPPNHNTGGTGGTANNNNNNNNNHHHIINNNPHAMLGMPWR